jgi:enoyl-CoA hydratase
MTVRIATEGRIRIITIARPEARNAVDPATATALFEAFLAFEADVTADVAILTGEGQAFCAGFDLKAAAAGMDETWTTRHAIPEDWDNPVNQPLPSPMGPARLMLSKPVIAAIEGPAVAGGMELALWCDLRVMGQSAYFGVFCRRWGVPLIDGGTVRLPAIVGQGRASDLILTGRAVHAEEAAAIGLASQVVGDGAALSEARKLAESLLKFPQMCLRADRIAARPSPADMARALSREWQSAGLILSEAMTGASRFAAGKGRGGDFGEI